MSSELSFYLKTEHFLQKLTGSAESICLFPGGWCHKKGYEQPVLVSILPKYPLAELNCIKLHLQPVWQELLPPLPVLCLNIFMQVSRTMSSCKRFEIRLLGSQVCGNLRHLHGHRLRCCQRSFTCTAGLQLDHCTAKHKNSCRGLSKSLFSGDG